MGKRVFVSYSHKQGEWVHDRLCPVLRAGGVDILIDKTRFEPGVAIYQQMDATQDQAELHLLVLSPDYLASAACQHEMARALAVDPNFTSNRVLPVVRVPCALPPEIKGPNPLYLKLDNDAADQWDLLAKGCGVDLGVSPADWLMAREKLRRNLDDGRSINLIVRGGPNRRGLFEQLQEDVKGLALVDLTNGATVSRQGLVAEILRGLGMRAPVQAPPHDLADLQHRVESAPKPARLALQHFDAVQSRLGEYRDDLFHALKHLVDTRKLVLVVESRVPYASLLPATNALSGIQMAAVELNGRAGIP